MSTDIESLERTVKEYEKQAEEAREFFARAESQLRGADRDLKLARDFLEMERGRQSASGESPFAGMVLSEALSSVLRQLQRATAEQLIAAVKGQGWAFEKLPTGRTVHAALMHVDEVRKVAPKTYEISIGGVQPAATGTLSVSQPPMPLNGRGDSDGTKD